MKKLILIFAITISLLSCEGQIPGIGRMMPIEQQQSSSNTTIKLGYLYNFWAVQGDSLAADGWHVPTQAEYIALSDYLGGSTISGQHIKEATTDYWSTSDYADNTSGFSLRGNGYRLSSGLFGGLGVWGVVWSSTMATTSWARNISVRNTETIMNFYNYPSGSGSTRTGAAVRLLKNDSNFVESYTGNDGKVYECIQIGTQIWTKYNLAETLYVGGTPIPEVTDNATWSGLTTYGQGARCSFNNDESNAF